MPTPPYTYEYINSVQGPRMPSFIHISSSQISKYFKRYLMLDAMSVFDYTLPDNWDSDYFRYVLLGLGYLAVIKTDKFGIIPQKCSLTGYNVFYRPSEALIANPLLKSRRLIIGKDCELIRLSPDYGSIADLVDNYGNMMALAYETAAVNIINSKLSYVFAVDGKSDADTFKAVYDNIASGEPAVYYRKNSKKLAEPEDAWKPFQQNVGQNFIAPQVFEMLQSIRDAFLTDIGIPNLATRKKERVNTLEADKNTVATESKARLWLEEQRECISRVIDMFPELDGQLDVNLRFEEDDGIVG